MQNEHKVLHIITSLGHGGAEALLVALCSSGSSTKHTVVSLTGGGSNADLLRQAGVDVHVLELGLRATAFGGLFRLAKILTRSNYDVVHTWMYHANLLGGALAKVLGARHILWSIHHSELGRRSKWSTRLVNQVSAWLSHVVPDEIIAVSSHVAEVHLSCGYKDAFTIISNGCDTDRFTPRQSIGLRQELDIPSDAFVLGCVARFSPEKGHDVVISAMTELLRDRQDIYLVFVGPGCSRDNERFVSALRTLADCQRVICLGARGDVPSVMRLFDLHVLASREEAFGNVTVEAMASGVPCVVSRTGAAEQIVANVGWSVPVGDISSLRAAILIAFEEWRESPLWYRRRQDSRKRVIDNFSMETCLRRYEEVWSKYGI